jgi:hypothetical protein
MKTSIEWAWKANGDEQIIPGDWDEKGMGYLPDKYFDCVRLEVGDKIELWIELLNGSTLSYYVKVVEVTYFMSYDLKSYLDKEGNPYIGTSEIIPCQRVCVTE